MSIVISEEDLDALARTIQSEVGHFRGKALKNGVNYTLDTILNRTESPQFPGSVQGVVDQRGQFSAISGNRNAAGSWESLPAASQAVVEAVVEHLAERAVGLAEDSVKGGLHFGNSNRGVLSRVGASPATMNAMQALRDNATAVLGNLNSQNHHVYGTRAGYTPISAKDIELTKNAIDMIAPPTPAARGLANQSGYPIRDALSQVEHIPGMPSPKPGVYSPSTAAMIGAATSSLATGSMGGPNTRGGITGKGSPIHGAIQGPENLPALPSTPVERHSLAPLELSGPAISSGPPARNGPRGSRATSGSQAQAIADALGGYGVPSMPGIDRPSNAVPGITAVAKATNTPEYAPSARVSVDLSGYGTPVEGFVSGPSARNGPRGSRATSSIATGPTARNGPRGSRAAPAISSGPPSRNGPRGGPSINQAINDTAISGGSVVPTPAAKPSLNETPQTAQSTNRAGLPSVNAATINGIGIPEAKPTPPEKDNKKGKTIGKVAGALVGGYLAGPIGALGGAYIGSRIGKNGLPSLPKISLGPLASKESFGQTAAGKAYNDALNGGDFWGTYSKAGGPEDAKSTAAAMSLEQSARAARGDKTWGDAWGDAWGDKAASGSGAGSSGSDAGGFCFLTTAAVDICGEQDDGDTLQTLRWFRDNIMRARPDWSADVDEYYRIAPEIVKRLNGDKATYRQLMSDHIRPAVQAVKTGDYEAAYCIYRAMVEELK